MKREIIWLTGLLGAGKSTLACALHKRLMQMGISSVVVESGQFREAYYPDVGFSNYERFKIQMRLSDHALKLSQKHSVVIVVSIAPLEAARIAVREKLGDAYSEIFLDTPIDICEARDKKGWYYKAHRGIVNHFTGVSSPYDRPRKPDVHIVYPEDLSRSVERVLGSLNIEKAMTTC